MLDEHVTGLYFVGKLHCMWIMYTEMHPERIDGINQDEYSDLLNNISKTNGTRYELYSLLRHKR